jgi:tetratricopeptide (TPR) repeat protein
MMQLITKYYLIFIFLCVPFITNGQFAVADSLYQLGKSQYASLEYERVVFSNEDPTIKNRALLQKAYCLKALGDHTGAHKTLQRANYYISQDSLNFEMRYELALNAYLSGDFNTALAQLVQIEYFFKDNGYNDVSYLHILTLNELTRWDEAKEKYKQYASINTVSITADEAYYFLDKPRLKKPDKAEKISYVLPGVGQMYAGYPVKGIVSSLIQLSLMGFGAYSLYEGYFFTGALTGVGLFWSFYTGGARNAKYLAQRKNEELVSKYNEGIREILLNSEVKSK